MTMPAQIDTLETLHAARAHVLKTRTMDTIRSLITRARAYREYLSISNHLAQPKFSLSTKQVLQYARNPYVVSDRTLLECFTTQLWSKPLTVVAEAIAQSPALARAVLLYHPIGKSFLLKKNEKARQIVIERARTDREFNVILQRFIELNPGADLLFVDVPKVPAKKPADQETNRELPVTGQSPWYKRLLAGSVAGLALSIGLHTSLAAILGFSATALWPIAVAVGLGALLALAKPYLVKFYRWCVAQPDRARESVARWQAKGTTAKRREQSLQSWAGLTIKVLILASVVFAGLFISFVLMMFGVFGSPALASALILGAVFGLLGVVVCALIPFCLASFSNFFAIAGSDTCLPLGLWLRAVLARSLSLLVTVVVVTLLAVAAGFVLFHGGFVLSQAVLPLLQNSVTMSQIVGYFMPAAIMLFAPVNGVVAWRFRNSPSAAESLRRPMDTAWESRLAMSTVLGLLIAGAAIVLIPGAPSILLLFGVFFGVTHSILPGFDGYFCDNNLLGHPPLLGNPSLWNAFRGALTGLGLGASVGLIGSLIVAGTIFPGIGTLGASIILMSAAIGMLTMMLVGGFAGDAIPGPLRELGFLETKVSTAANVGSGNTLGPAPDKRDGSPGPKKLAALIATSTNTPSSTAPQRIASPQIGQYQQQTASLPTVNVFRSEAVTTPQPAVGLVTKTAPASAENRVAVVGLKPTTSSAVEIAPTPAGKAVATPSREGEAVANVTPPPSTELTGVVKAAKFAAMSVSSIAVRPTKSAVVQVVQPKDSLASAKSAAVNASRSTGGLGGAKAATTSQSSSSTPSVAQSAAVSALRPTGSSDGVVKAPAKAATATSSASSLSTPVSAKSVAVSVLQSIGGSVAKASPSTGPVASSSAHSGASSSARSSASHAAKLGESLGAAISQRKPLWNRLAALRRVRQPRITDEVRAAEMSNTGQSAKTTPAPAAK